MSVPAYLITPTLLALGGALAAVPIIIHLLSRRRVRRVRWAAMQWLLAAMKRHQRRLRLENWLLLLLRVAAIVLLGLALARPVLTDSNLAGLAAGKRSVYLVLDNSFSTEAKLDARSVLENVKHEADLVLRSLGPDDAAAVIVTNDPDEDATNGIAPHVLMGRSVGAEGAARAREAVAALRTRHAPANWAETLQRVQEQMADEDVNRSVVVVTDLQAKDWLRPPRERLAPADGSGGPAGPADTSAPAGDRLRDRMVAILRRPATVRVINVGGRDRRDLAITKVENRSEQDPFVNRPLRLAVTVANYGDIPVSGAQVEVRVDGSDRTHNVEVPDLAAANTNLRVPEPATEIVHVDLPKLVFRNPGAHSIRVTVLPPRSDPSADALGLSSEHWLALMVRRKVNVVAWAHTSRNEQNVDAYDYLRGVYLGDADEDRGSVSAGLPAIYSFEAATTEANLLGRMRGRGRAPIDLVVLANVVPRDERLVHTLREYVREGGGLLVFTGDNVDDPEALNSVFHTADPASRLMPYPYDPPELRKRSGEGRSADSDGQRPFALDLSFQESPHPLAEPFTNVKADDWIKRYPPAIWGRMPFGAPAPLPESTDGGSEGPARSADEAYVVLRFESQEEAEGPPAVVASRFGEGRTVWVATSIDNGWLATAVLFLPVFLEEAAMFLTRPAEAGRNMGVGDVLRASLPADAEKVRLTRPGGGPISPSRRTPDDEDAARVEYSHAEIGRAGVWRLTYQVPSVTGDAEEVRDDYAVNVDAREGSLFSAEERAIRDGIPSELDLSFLRSYADVSSEIEEAREGEISRLLLWLLLGVLLLESFLALTFGRRGAAPAGKDGAAA